MRLALIVLALACAAMAEEKVVEALPAPAALAEPAAEAAAPTAVEPEAAASAPVEASKPGKSSRSNDQAPKVYYARPAQPQAAAQSRDGAHHHDHGHGHHDHHAAPAPIQYSQPAPQAYESQPSYDQAPQQYAPQAPQPYEQQPAQPYSAPAPSYDAAPQYPQAPAQAYSAPAASYDQPAAAPAYSTPGHQGYYYYYYPVKDSKVKLKLPKLPKMPSLPSLRLPEYYGKDGGVSSVKSFGVAAITAALVGVGAFLSLPIIGLGVGKRSFSSLWESEYLSRDNLNVLAEYIINIVDNYKPSNQ
ncbi:hypothetical protein GHT06_020819 [Daphnia sinensis]|uniref:Cuticular protein n=1 Tax=Daphnia sinensis TaxID=1820382 RepID=A0AAD5KID0_9CRUS|nr:hypothetical protein GHT06_020819 [Daphnia sinensis]